MLIDFAKKVPPEQKTDPDSSTVYFVFVLCSLLVDTHHIAVFMFLFFKICQNVTQNCLQRAVVFCVAAAILVLNGSAVFFCSGDRCALTGIWHVRKPDPSEEGGEEIFFL